MTDSQLEEILDKHDSVLSGPMLVKDIVSAMREAVDKAVGEAIFNSRMVTTEYEIPKEILEEYSRQAVEKGSIGFATWIHEKDWHWNWYYKVWAMGHITHKGSVERLGISNEQLYNEYQEYLKANK